MFTGIVQALCPVRQLADEAGLRRLGLALGSAAADLAAGASVAVNGVCLTVSEQVGDITFFNVVQETLNRTNLGALGQGDRVNVERSVRIGDEIGGHLLSGHVWGLAELKRIESGPNRRDLWFEAPTDAGHYLLRKGFVALDGASLTIADLDASKHWLKVALVPDTIERTTLGAMQTGAFANLEVDAATQAIVETVARVLAEQASQEEPQ